MPAETNAVHSIRLYFNVLWY